MGQFHDAIGIYTNEPKIPHGRGWFSEKEQELLFGPCVDDPWITSITRQFVLFSFLDP